MKYIFHMLPNRAHNLSHESNLLKKNLRGITYAIVALLVSFNIVLSIFLLGALKDSEDATLKIMRAKEIAAVSSNLSKHVYDAGVALGGLSVTKSQLFCDRFDKLISAIPHEVTDLKDLIEQKNARQFDALMKVAELLPDTIKYMGEVRTQIMNSKETGLGRGDRGLFARMHANAGAIQKSLQLIVDENKELANLKVPAHLINFETINIWLLASLVVNILLGFLTFFLLSNQLNASPHEPQNLASGS